MDIGRVAFAEYGKNHYDQCRAVQPSIWTGWGEEPEQSQQKGGTMRVGIAGLIHESDSFSSQPTTLERFKEQGILRGEELVAQHRHSHSVIAGYLEGIENAGLTAVPLYYTFAMPMAPVTSDAFETVVGQLLDSINNAGRLDGLLLWVHGAHVSEQYSDADGEISARVRRLLGPDLPIMGTPDIHANISQRMIDNTTANVVFRMNPHLDTKERGLETADLMARTLKGEITPVQWLETPPMIINILKQHTREEPCLSLINDADEAAKRPGVLSTSVALGYQYSDVAEMGTSFVAVADGDVRTAQEAARWMARRAWARREEFVGEALPPEDALKEAQAYSGKPVVLMDVGDNVGGGSTADSTILLEAAIRLGIGDLLVALKDPEAVKECVKLGVGSEISISVGGKTDDMHGRPVPIRGRVRCIQDGQYEEDKPMHGGFRFFNQGITAVVETSERHTIVLTSLPSGSSSLEQMRSVGVTPERKKLVIAKGVVAPRGAYQPIAAKIFLVDTPGATCANLFQWEYRNRRRPMFPFEQEAQYELGY
jgi:microcystin degradation protein MlrC